MKLKFQDCIQILALSIIILITMLSLSCSEEEKPEITGCDSFKYKGVTYSSVSCRGGLRGFDFAQTWEGNTDPVPQFHIQCSTAGCIESVTVLSEDSGFPVQP